MAERDVRCRAWCFTSFEADPPLFDVANMDYLVYQREVCPDTGREHWQSFVVFKKRARLARAKRETGCATGHFEVSRAKDLTVAAAYCKKQESRKPGTEPFEFGELPDIRTGQGNRSDLEEFAKAIRSATPIRDILEKYPVESVKYCSSMLKLRSFAPPPVRDSVTTFLFWGATGSGKTHLAFELAPNAYRVMYGNCGTWFDGYDGENEIILDEFDGTQMSIGQLLQICDKYRYRIEYKGGSNWSAWSAVFITANHDYKSWYDPYKVGSGRMEALGRRLNPPYGKTFLIENREDQDIVRKHFQDPPANSSPNQ